VDACCKYGFQGLTIETKEEIECLFLLNKRLKTIFCFCNATAKKNLSKIEKLGAALTGWSSGTNQGPLSEINYGWCSSNQSLARSVLSPFFPENLWTNRCVAFTTDSKIVKDNYLIDVDCSIPLPPFCEFY